MTVYIVRRIVNYLILTAVASSLAYVLASIGLNPVWQFENRHPRPPQSSIDQLLDAWGVNPKIPLIERTWTWFINMFHGDLGLTVGNQPVTVMLSLDWTQTHSVQELEDMFQLGGRILNTVDF